MNKFQLNRIPLKLTTSMHRYFLLYGFLLTTVVSQAQNEVEKTIQDLEQIGVKGILPADTSLLAQIWAPEFMVTPPP